jgi:hypothetical protein
MLQYFTKSIWIYQNILVSIRYFIDSYIDYNFIKDKPNITNSVYDNLKLDKPNIPTSPFDNKPNIRTHQSIW